MRNTDDLGPVEGEHTEAQARRRAKDHIDDRVGRCDPADPREVAEAGEEVSRQPVERARTDHTNKEELETTHVVLLVLVPRTVQCLHETAADERTGPDHVGWPNGDLTVETSHANAHKLRRQADEHSVASGELLAVYAALDDEGGANVRSVPGYVDHGDDHGVLLNVEGSRVQ